RADGGGELAMAREQSTVEHRRSAGASPRPSSRRAPHADIAEALSQRVVVERIEPEIDGGRFPIKRTIGETVDVSATIFADGQDVAVELLEGALLMRDAAGRAVDSDAAWLLEQADALSDATPAADRLAVALGEELAAAMAAYADRSRATESAHRRVWVDRVRA